MTLQGRTDRGVMSTTLLPGAGLIVAGGILLAVYALFIRTDPQSPNIGGGFVVLLAYGLLGAGVILLLVDLLNRRRR